MTRRALISVTDKTGVVEFARGLVGHGFSILSTGGTYRVIQEAGVAVEEVAEYTGFPEMMDGRIKTLHPKVHGGLLARRDDAGHVASMQAHGIDGIDVLAVNLYAFRETCRKEGVGAEEIIENIDIGGPAMLRSAAKNHRDVAVVVDPGDYGMVLEALEQHGGELPLELGRGLAGKAFAHTASYDVAISQWFAGGPGEGGSFAGQYGLVGEKVQDLRYGENPQQAAAFYRDPDQPVPSLAAARQLSGKELSYNNILDLDAAMALALDFEEPACAIIKHNNPCGVAVAADTGKAFVAALASDPVSAFGGIVAMNGTLDADTAQAMARGADFLEAILAPEVEPAALEILRGAKWGKNVRVLALGGVPARDEQVLLRQVSGGFLLQTYKPGFLCSQEKVASQRGPTKEERAALLFGMRVCKHVKSNAILLARAGGDGISATVGVGAGQMSRVDSVEIAVGKAGGRARGSVLASDAFFPFVDGIEVAAKAGVTAIIQPGGSKRDAEVIAAVDEAGMAMLFTGARHFRH